MSNIVDNLETVLIEAHKVKGWPWVHQEPLWVTWPLEKFGGHLIFVHTILACSNHVPVTQIPAVLPPYHKSLAFHVELVDKLRNHSVSFEDSRDAINKWAEQPWLGDEGWNAAWEDLCEAEVERWG